MKRIFSLLVIAIFLAQQVCFAGSFKDDLKFTLKSNFPRAYSAAQRINNSVSSAYTAASKIHSAVKSVTDISARDIISYPGSFIATKLGISAINNYRNWTVNNLQTYSQPISSTTIQSSAFSSTALNSSISSLPPLSTQNTLSSNDPCNNGGPCFNIDRNPQPSFDERSKQLLSREWVYRYVVVPITSQYYNSEVVNWNKTPLTDPEVMREKEWTAVTMGLYLLPVGAEVGIAERLGISTIKYAEPIIQTLKPLTSNVGLRQGFNYIRPVSNMIWGNPWVRIPIAFTGAEVVVNIGYGLIPGLKSPTYNVFADNNGRTGYLMNEIRREEHLLAPGKYNDEVLSGLSEVFPYGLATPDGVKRYFEERNIKTNEKVVAYATEIASLNAQNQNLANGFNWYEKGFTRMAGLSDSLFTPISKGLDNYGVPFAGAFIKNSIGSFNPLTGLSIGANAGANPSYSWRGFADFTVNFLEAGIGLRRGSIVDGSWDYDPGYRNLGEAVGTLFILRGGGGEALRAAKSAKTQLGSLSFSSAYTKYKAPVTMAVMTLPLAAAAWWEGGQTGDFGAPAGATAVMAANMFAPMGISVVKGRLSGEPIIISNNAEVVTKTEGMDNALSILSKMMKENGRDIEQETAVGKTFIEAVVPTGELFKVGPYSYTELKTDSPRGFLLYPSLLSTEVGKPVILFPVTSLPNSQLNNNNDKFKKNLNTLLPGIDIAKSDLSKNKQPIPVEKLRDDQVSTLMKLVTELNPQDRMAIIRGLGTGKTTALLSYALPYRIGDNLKQGKVTLILTPNNEVTNDVKIILKGANRQGFNHKQIQERLGTNIEFPKEITEKELKIESVTRNEDSLKQQEDFIEKVMNNHVVVVPYDLYSSIYHTYLMRVGEVEPARQNVINRIQDSSFFIDEVDLPAFLPSLMMSEGRMYVPEGHPEYNYWLAVLRKSSRLYDNAKQGKIDLNKMEIEKIKGESEQEYNFRLFAQGQKLKNGYIPAIEDLPSPDSAVVKDLVKEIRSDHLDTAYTNEEIAEHIIGGARGYRDYELRNSFTKEAYAIKTETIPAEQIDIYGPKKSVNTVKIGGVEGRSTHNFNLHIPAGEQQILEMLHGAKLISRPLKGDHIGKSIDALEILGGGIGFTGTASDTAKPVLKKAGFTKFDYGEVKATDFETPVLNEDLSQTVKQVTDSIVNNKGNGLDIDMTPNNLVSRLVKKVLKSNGVKPAVLVKEGENYKFIEGKYIHIGGRTPEKVGQALLDSLRTEKAPYAIIGDSNLIGRGLNFDPSPYLAKEGTKVVVNLIEPELMTATQVNQGAGRIGGEFRFTNLKDKEGNIYNPQKSVRLLMSKDMMRLMPEFEEVLKLDNSQEGVKSLKIMDALHNVWNKNERDVVARSGLSSEIIDSKLVKSEFKEVDIPTTLDKIKERDVRDYLVLKGYTTESIVKKGQAYVKENKLTVKGLRFMQLLKEAEALSDEQHKILDKITELRLLNIHNPVQFAIGLTEKGIVELEEYNKKGLTSVICLGRILRPFNTDISSEEINGYQNIINSSSEQKLEFIKGLIDKNKIKIDDPAAKELILKKLELQKESLEKIQEISRQISTEYAKNKGNIAQNDRLRLKSAYQEFENIMTYEDLENISSKLNYPVLTDLLPLFIPNVSVDEIARFSAIFDFAKNYKINLAPYNLFELLNLTNDNNKIDFAKFIDKNIRDPYLKIYAQRLALYENTLAKQMQYYIQLFSGKTKDAKEYEQSLQEDVDFFRNFNIDPRRDTHLNLVQLRSLSDEKLPDNLLLRIYLGFGISDEGIENVIVDEEINNIVLKKGTSQEVSEALAELVRIGKLWGMERTIRELQSKYTSDVVNEAVKEYLAIKAKQIQPGTGTVFKPEVTPAAASNLNLPAVVPSAVLPVEATVNPGIVAAAAVDGSG